MGIIAGFFHTIFDPLEGFFTGLQLESSVQRGAVAGLLTFAIIAVARPTALYNADGSAKKFKLGAAPLTDKKGNTMDDPNTTWTPWWMIPIGVFVFVALVL